MIPIRKFAEMVRDIDAAYKAGDYQVVVNIQKMFEPLNIQVYWQDDEPYFYHIERQDTINPEKPNEQQPED